MTELPEASEVRELVERFSVLPRLRHQRERLDRLLEDYARGRGDERRALTAALIGATGAGKSTLLNALAGSRIATEGVDRPTSRSLVVYAPEDAQLGALEKLGGRIERYSGARTANTWTGQVFLDTPDLNSVEQANRQVARSGLEQADVAIVVLHRGSVAEATQIDFLSEFARRRRVLFVLNFADELGPTAREELKTQVQRIAATQFKLAPEDAPVFAISALNARRGDGELFEYPKLLAALKDLAERATVERVRASNAVAALREIVQRLDEAGAELDALRAGAADDLRVGLDRVRDQLIADLDARLEAAQPHLAQRVRAQAAGRWWGPAALWMRLSTVGAGGFGAAALVARQNLPVGLAVAAASAAVNAVQDRTRAKSAENVVVGNDEELAAAQWLRGAITAPRQRALAADLSPSQFQIPELALMAEALTGLRASAFTYAQNDAISESVSRWWKWARWILLPVVNLPLFALGGDVAWHVVRGYLSGQYVSSEYFLNALALATLLSIVGALLASVSLAGVAKRARGLAQRRFAAGLEALSNGWVSGVQESMPELVAARARLDALRKL